MLRSGRDDRHAHLDRTEQVGHLRETVRAEPLDVLHRLVDRVVPLLARRVSGFAVRRTVDDHQSAFGDGQLHQRRFADDREFQRPQFRDHAFESVVPAVLLLGRDRYA